MSDVSFAWEENNNNESNNVMLTFDIKELAAIIVYIVVDINGTQ
jgi:hypothetical protein